jgi:proline iminopeptidase
VFVTINGNRLLVETLGPEGAPVLVAHHGAPGLSSHAEPRDSFGRLADTFRVVLFDARGSGESEGNPPFSHEQWADDVEGLREWAGAERIVMAGGSYGGFISMEYALRYPDRVSALVLRDTSADHENLKAARRNAETNTRVDIDWEKFDRMMAGTVRDDADLRDCWREILPLYDHVYDPQAVERRFEQTWFRFETHNYSFAVNMPQYDIKPLLPRISCPTLVTVGRSDWITPVEHSEVIADLIPHSELVVFEQSGHSPQVEEAELWTETVRDFLTRHDTHYAHARGHERSS